MGAPNYRNGPLKAHSITVMASQCALNKRNEENRYQKPDAPNYRNAEKRKPITIIRCFRVPMEVPDVLSMFISHIYNRRLETNPNRLPLALNISYR